MSLMQKLFLGTLSLISLTSFTHNDVEGTDPVAIPTNQPATLDKKLVATPKIISLLKIKPTEMMIQQNNDARVARTLKGGELDYSQGITPFSLSKGAVDLGMSNVPVLDQGSEGTCVTFSSTGALDARFNLGDGIDQQCLLAFLKSGAQNYWDGAIGPFQIFMPIQMFGYVPKGKCPGNEQYPDPNETVYLWDYSKVSNTTYDSSISYSLGTGANLTAVKAAVNAGSRVLLSIGLHVIDNDAVSVSGFNITVNGNKDSGGLWACQQPGNSTDYCAAETDGHEIIVIGYDDTQQLLKIRNSWGASVGDQGDFYMTYDFFNAMVEDYTVLN